MGDVIGFPEREVSRLELTDDQREMITLLGGHPATQRRSNYPTFDLETWNEIPVSCPIIEWRGRLRVILPSGSLINFEGLEAYVRCGGPILPLEPVPGR